MPAARNRQNVTVAADIVEIAKMKPATPAPTPQVAAPAATEATPAQSVRSPAGAAGETGRREADASVCCTGEWTMRLMVGEIAWHAIAAVALLQRILA